MGCRTWKQHFRAQHAGEWKRTDLAHQVQEVDDQFGFGDPHVVDSLEFTGSEKNQTIAWFDAKQLTFEVSHIVCNGSNPVSSAGSPVLAANEYFIPSMDVGD